MFNPILDCDYAHADAVRTIGPIRGLIKVNLIEIDWDQMAERNLALIRENIRLRNERAEKEALTNLL